MSDVFREVDEEVRREQAAKLWRVYGKYIIVAVAAVVIGIGGKVGWEKYRLSQRVAESARFDAAVEMLTSGDAEAAAREFAALAADAGDGYALLARLREAQALIAAGKKEEAVAALDQLAADEGADQATRDLAALLAALQVMDNAAAEEIDRRLAPLVAEGSVWRANAREIQGLVALRRGERAEARKIFSALADKTDAPPALRRRVAEYLAILGGAENTGS